MKRHLQTYEGRSRLVQEGQRPLAVVYTLEEYQDVIDAGSMDDPHATIPGMKSLEGQIRTQDGSFLVVSLREPLVLHLQDGRRLKLLIRRTTGRGGAVVIGNGGFF